MAKAMSKDLLLAANLYFLLGLELTAAALFYPLNSGCNIFVAVAVPLDLPDQHVFLSYNFQVSFGVPHQMNDTTATIGILEDLAFEDEGRQCTNCTMNEEEDSSSVTEAINEDNEKTETTNEFTTESTDIITDQPETKKIKKRQQRSLFSRTHFYFILMDKFQRSGFEGEDCLLRLICETNSSDLGDINGILGNLIHIVFSPSTSKNEELPLAYYQAEIDGVHDQCEKYNKNCKKNLLDLISKPLVDIITNMMPNK